MPVLARLGQPTEPAIQQAGDLDVVQHAVQPRQRKQLVLVAAARPTAIDPQQVTPDRGDRQALGGVGVALEVVQHLLVAPAGGSLHPGRQPVNNDRLAGTCHLHQQFAQVVEAGDERAVGLAEPQRGQFAQQQVQAVADLGLGDADHATSAPVRQPVQQHRPDRVQADLQRQRRGAALAGRAGWQQVGQAGGQPGQHPCGQRRTWAVWQRGPDLLAGVRHLAYGLVPVNVRAHGASRTPSVAPCFVPRERRRSTAQPVESELEPLLATLAPTLLAEPGIGTISAAMDMGSW